MKRIMTALIAFSLLLSFAACSSSKLADIYSQDEVIARAKDFVDTINTLDYDAVVSGIREDLQSQVTSESLKSAWGPLLDEAGAFEEYKTVVAYGQKDKTTDEDYAVCVLVCTYENASRTFTISMDKNLEIVGLYMK